LAPSEQDANQASVEVRVRVVGAQDTRSEYNSFFVGLKPSREKLLRTGRQDAVEQLPLFARDPLRVQFYYNYAENEAGKPATPKRETVLGASGWSLIEALFDPRIKITEELDAATGKVKRWQVSVPDFGRTTTGKIEAGGARVDMVVDFPRPLPPRKNWPNSPDASRATPAKGAGAPGAPGQPNAAANDVQVIPPPTKTAVAPKGAAAARPVPVVRPAPAPIGTVRQAAPLEGQQAR
jgi:hypothetical protein